MKFFYEEKGLTIQNGYGNSLTFGAHLHNHIELVYMIDGRSKAFVESMECEICSGDAFIVFPNKIHQYQKIDNEYYFISIFPADLCPEFQSIFKTKVPISPVIKNASKNVNVLALTKSIVELNDNRSPFHDTLLKGYFLILLSELFQMIKFEEAKASDANTTKLILNYCYENYKKDIKLTTVSDALHINKYYISHLFSDKLRIGFSEYIAMLRISDSCNLLSNSDLSITEISYSVGFNSARSYNRQFLKCIGQTPSQYRNSPNKIDRNRML